MMHTQHDLLKFQLHRKRNIIFTQLYTPATKIFTFLLFPPIFWAFSIYLPCLLFANSAFLPYVYYIRLRQKLSMLGDVLPFFTDFILKNSCRSIHPLYTNIQMRKKFQGKFVPGINNACFEDKHFCPVKLAGSIRKVLLLLLLPVYKYHRENLEFACIRRNLEYCRTKLSALLIPVVSYLHRNTHTQSITLLILTVDTRSVTHRISMNLSKKPIQKKALL